MTAVRGRFAPSPTGLMHLGNARTALAAWLSARRDGGAFALRIEDLDRPRIVPGADAAILEDLRWLGLDWDEGPDVGGPFGPYRQSERADRYDAALERLASGGLLFPCTCSRAELRRVASAPQAGAEDGPPYPGHCRSRPLPDDWRELRVRHSLRFRVPAGEVCFADRLFGRCCQDVLAAVGDVVLRRADGLHAYQLAVVVDDAAMGITEVVRGADLLSSTPRQILLYRALGLDPPAFAHVPLVLGLDGERLAKRHGAVSIAEARAAGRRSEDVVGLLAHSLGLLDRSEPVTPAELVPHFQWSRLRREAWRLDLAHGW
ncbi:MAG: tRNA glutamyl-Q(34) synthetase GluQRS [Chloroflexi bacterium]|nr:tRNA glutamyl-Q(34) synthetase GluQRS [Chloroflexota bacterium]